MGVGSSGPADGTSHRSAPAWATIRRHITVLLLAVLLGRGGAVRADGLLAVETLSGSARVERLGSQLQLKPGDALCERDVISVDDGARLSLSFGHHGFLELGPGTQMGLEKLPYASYAADLNSIFSLGRGYLRIVWKQAGTPAWPLFVYFGGQRASVGSGEYFFDARPGLVRTCVAAGELGVLPLSARAAQRLQGGACYRLVAGRPPETLTRDPEGWIAMRRGFSMDAPESEEAALAAAERRQAALPDTVPAEPPSGPAPAVASARTPPPSSAPETMSVDPPKPPAAGASRSAGANLAAAAASDTVAATASVASGEWIINLASYPESSDAERHAGRLRAQGYAAAVQPAEVRGKAWYRVQIGGYASAEAARDAGEALKAKLGVKTLWIMRR